MFCVHLVFDFTKRRTEFSSQSFKKHFAKSITKEVVIKVFYRSPRSDVAGPAFRDEGMDMRIPL